MEKYYGCLAQYARDLIQAIAHTWEQCRHDPDFRNRADIWPWVANTLQEELHRTALAAGLWENLDGKE